jgi:hypothetical protein
MPKAQLLEECSKYIILKKFYVARQMCSKDQSLRFDEEITRVSKSFTPQKVPLSFRCRVISALTPLNYHLYF